RTQMLKRGEDFFEILAVLAGVGGHDFRGLSQGAALNHDRAVEANLFQLAEDGREIHLAGAELEPDAAFLFRAIFGAETGDMLRNELELLDRVAARVEDDIAGV